MVSFDSLAVGFILGVLAAWLTNPYISKLSEEVGRLQREALEKRNNAIKKLKGGGGLG